MNNIYIASTLSNMPRVQRLRDALKPHGVGLTYDWTEHNSGTPYIPDSQPLHKRSVAEKELIGVYTAKAILVVLPGGGGTHFEFSAAFVWKKPIVLLVDEAPAYTPSFHYLEDVVRAASESEALNLVLQFVRGERAVSENHFIDRLLRGDYQC